MSDTSARLGWSVPNPYEDPYYEAFLALINAIDASVYGPVREDRNLVLMSTATVSFGSDTLAWNAPIELLCAPQGTLWRLPAGSTALTDGQILYVLLPRAPTGTVQVVARVAATAPQPSEDADAALVLAVRRGSVIYWRNGRVLANGESGSIFTASSTPPSLAFYQNGALIGSRATFNLVTGLASLVDNPGASRVDLTIPARGAATQMLQERIPVALGVHTDSTTAVIAGHAMWNPAEAAFAGFSVVARFVVLGYTSVPGVTGYVTLEDLDDGAVTHTFTFSNTVQPTEQTYTFTPSAGNHRYRVTFRATGSTSPAERFFLDWAGLRVDRVVS